MSGPGDQLRLCGSPILSRVFVRDQRGVWEIASLIRMQGRVGKDGEGVVFEKRVENIKNVI